MKQKLAIYFAALVMLFTGVSCMSDDEESVVLSPYAMVTSFSIGNIKSSYHAFTSTGEDTTVVRTLSSALYPFTINHSTGEIFNADSLPFGTDVSKVVMNISLKGVACIYTDSTGTFDYFSMTDSIDFTVPRKFRIYSADKGYERDYTVTVNVHKVEPELLSWNKYSAPEDFLPSCAVEFCGEMKLFGSVAGTLSVASAGLAGEPAWELSPLSGLPVTAKLANVQQFGGSLYTVAEGSLYISADAVNWAVASQESGVVAIVGASDADGKIWIAGEQGVKYSADGASFEQAQELPAGFPLYGLSLSSYPLLHNRNIIRYMLIGYTTPEMNGEPAVWSRLSTENDWVLYDNGNGFACPSLKGLSVVRYDNSLYAFGSSGVAGGESIGAFSSFFVSKDNGIVWKASENYYQRLPKELAGNESQFVATVDSANFIWIVNSGSDAGVWKGIINRLGFKK